MRRMQRASLAAALLTVLGSALAAAATADVAPNEQAVSPIMAYYPAQARDAGLEGRVSLHCIKTVHNRLTKCSIVSEQPRGYGFGDAAVTLSKLSVDNPKVSISLDLRGEIVPFSFSLHPPSITPNTLEPLHIFTPPDWRSRPSGNDVARVDPRHARDIGEDGLATIFCDVRSDGRLDGCSVVEENPQGEGFGDAALKLAPAFSMRLSTVDGEPQKGGTVRIPIRFAVIQ